MQRRINVLVRVITKDNKYKFYRYNCKNSETFTDYCNKIISDNIRDVTIFINGYNIYACNKVSCYYSQPMYIKKEYKIELFKLRDNLVEYFKINDIMELV